MTPEKQQEILESAINTFGYTSQVDKMIEECAEIIQALLKLRFKEGYNKLNSNNIHEWENVHYELADLGIMYDQMKLLFSNDLIEKFRIEKLERLANMIKLHDTRTEAEN
jgi:NTP pyrophosphatase (non-canonical NTP hydrolase)